MRYTFNFFQYPYNVIKCKTVATVTSKIETE